MSSAGCKYCLDANSLKKQKQKHLSPRQETGSILVAIPDEKTTKILNSAQDYLTNWFLERDIKFCPVRFPHLTLSGHLKELDIPTAKTIAKEFVNIISENSWDFTFSVLFNCIKINLSNRNHSPYLCLDLTNIYKASETYIIISNELHTVLSQRKLLKKSKQFSPAFHLTLGTFPEENAEKVHLRSEHPTNTEECINKQLLMLQVKELLSSGEALNLSFEYVAIWLVHKVLNSKGIYTNREDTCRITYFPENSVNSTYQIETVGEEYLVPRQKTKTYNKFLYDKKTDTWSGNPINCHIIHYDQKQLITFAAEESETSFRWKGEVPNEPVPICSTQHICMKKGSVVVCSKCFSESVIDKNGWETQIGPYCAIHTIKQWTINKNKGISNHSR